MPTPRTIRAMLLALVLAAGAAGAGSSSQPNDSQITQAVQNQLHKNSAITGDISVESAGGVVTLNGHVPNDAERQLASRDAAGVSGVKVVTNNLTVTPPVPAETATTAMAPQPAPASSRRAAARPREGVAAIRTPQPEPAPVAPAPAAPPLTTVAAPPPPAPPPPAPSKYTIPAGTVLSVRLIDALDSSRNRVGDTFRATLDAPIRMDGEVVISAGLDVEGRVVEASNAGRYTGHPELSLELTKLISHGEIYSLRTDEYNRSGGGRGKGTAETIGTGAGLGAIIGGIAGGGKGAAIGAVAGAGAGGGARAAKKAPKISFPPESVLTFQLQESLTVPAIRGSDPSRRPWRGD